LLALQSRQQAGSLQDSIRNKKNVVGCALAAPRSFACVSAGQQKRGKRATYPGARGRHGLNPKLRAIGIRSSHLDFSPVDHGRLRTAVVS
jgi:hypothetical protein